MRPNQVVESGQIGADVRRRPRHLMLVLNARRSALFRPDEPHDASATRAEFVAGMVAR